MTSSNGQSSALLAICAGDSPATGEFPGQKPVTRSYDSWVYYGEAGDLRRHRDHYDVTVMQQVLLYIR